MATPKRVRWQCPNGVHPAVLGPRRPPLDATVRYCLPCSAQSTRLVARVAPVLERQRAAAAERAAAKAKTQRARAAVARDRQRQAVADRYTVDGVDLRTEFDRLIRLRAFGGKKGRLYRRPPRFDVSRRSRPGRQGVAYPEENRIIVAIHPRLALGDALETLVHELTHIVTVSEHCRHHGPEFYRLMDAAVFEAYRARPKGVRHNSYQSRYGGALRRPGQEES